MLVGELADNLQPHLDRLAAARQAVTEPLVWYQYDILGNVVHLNRMLSGSYRDLDVLAEHLPVADIGAADGDLAFTLEQACGWEIDIIETANTNQNGLRGAALLKAQLGSKVDIHDINLDEQFHLPREQYGLALFLGILYHLQNPYYALHHLAQHSKFCLLSTRVARFAGPQGTKIDGLPVGYLVGSSELNADATNYWVFSPAGLSRLVERAGWAIRSSLNVGDTTNSNPDSNENDERMFMLLESQINPG